MYGLFSICDRLMMCNFVSVFCCLCFVMCFVFGFWLIGWLVLVVWYWCGVFLGLVNNFCM